jgi:hypothetical protein
VITDVELNRAVNALSTTLRDQRPDVFDTERFQAIVDGALAGERKLVVRHLGGDRGELAGERGERLGAIDRPGGVWRAERERDR